MSEHGARDETDSNRGKREFVAAIYVYSVYSIQLGEFIFSM